MDFFDDGGHKTWRSRNEEDAVDPTTSGSMLAIRGGKSDQRQSCGDGEREKTAVRAQCRASGRLVMKHKRMTNRRRLSKFSNQPLEEIQRKKYQSN